jgi:hypothetical protein
VRWLGDELIFAFYAFELLWFNRQRDKAVLAVKEVRP